MKATIITIGDEILLGQILDTNSRYAADLLARVGIETIGIYSIADAPAEITKALDLALRQSDVVLLTGGLGPTKDDLTKKTLADYFHTSLVFNEETYHWVEELLASYPKASMNEYNKSQAFLPKDCTILRNLKGTASGMWFERGGKVVVSLPGVPFEAEALLKEEVLPRLEKRLGEDLLKYKMLGVFDVPEATLAMQLRAYEETLPKGLSLAYLPSAGYVRLRLTAKGEAVCRLEPFWQMLIKELSPFSFELCEEFSPEDVFAKKLRQHKVTIATAESCTGGNIAHLITAAAGSSAYFLGGIVSYANEVKINVLGVRAQDLQQYGAVSEAVALQMAEGARQVTGADYAVSTTGIAGPGGGSIQKPVGTIWIGVAGPKGVWAKEFHFSAVRERNIAKASVKALELLLKEIEKDEA